MPCTKTYIDPDISSFDALYQSFVGAGVPDVLITLNGELHVSTVIGNEAQCDAAVAAAAPGTLASNKTDRIAEVQRRTLELAALGVETWTPGTYTEMKTDYYTYASYYAANPGALTVATPFAAITLDGRADMTSVLADVDALVSNVAARMIYLYTAVANADGSKGEMPLILAIISAANQAALDAVVDTRT